MAGAECGDHSQVGARPSASLQPSLPSVPVVHWSRHLKCQVCYGFLQQPHTLPCGHSFCRACLVRLAQTTRASSVDVSIRYLQLPCPTCRTLFPAVNLVHGNAATSFLIQNLVADWRRERKRLQKSSKITLRSICTQTEPRPRRLRRRKSHHDLLDMGLHEQFHERWRPDDQYFRAMTYAHSDSSDGDMESKGYQPIYLQPDPSARDSEISTTSSSSSVRGFLLGGRRFVDLGRTTVGGRPVDWSPGRVILLSVWCMYSMVVVGMAQSMLPYMVLVTLFFLLVILR